MTMTGYYRMRAVQVTERKKPQGCADSALRYRAWPYNISKLGQGFS